MTAIVKAFLVFGFLTAMGATFSPLIVQYLSTPLDVIVFAEPLDYASPARTIVQETYDGDFTERLPDNCIIIVESGESDYTEIQCYAETLPSGLTIADKPRDNATLFLLGGFHSWENLSGTQYMVVTQDIRGCNGGGIYRAPFGSSWNNIASSGYANPGMGCNHAKVWDYIYSGASIVCSSLCNLFGPMNNYGSSWVIWE